MTLDLSAIPPLARQRLLAQWYAVVMRRYRLRKAAA